MIAVVELWWNQFIVKEWEIINVKKIEWEPNSKFSREALLISDEEGKDTKIWTPNLAGLKVEFKILDQFKDEKVRIFKKKSKKRYERNIGFRASLTKLEVVSIA